MISDPAKGKTISTKTAQQSRHTWRFWLGALVSLLCLGWVVATTNWSDTWQAVQTANYWLMPTAVLLNLLTIPMRTRRWQLLFPVSPRPHFGLLTRAMLIGQALNVVAPARLGDFVRASLVEEQPTAFVLGTQLLQTAFDLIMTAVLVLLILFRMTLPPAWRSSAEAVVITAAVALVGILLLLPARQWIIGWLHRIPQRWPRLPGQRLLGLGVDFLQSFDILKRPLPMLAALFWSVAIWVVYGLTNYVLLAALTPQATLLAAYFVLVVLQLGIAVPSSPGRVGVYHYLAVQALAVFAISNAPAVSFAIILHLISIVMPTIIGVVLAWQMGLGITGKLERDGVISDQ